ncbi:MULTISPECIES: DUF1905 domain-containing protein [unclassified Streptomyces]|uniref:DUF1905 domain-containing protein n=1 Tax=unclassified Streptomyces TaxID=2593676 RepID=UPI00382B8D08
MPRRPLSGQTGAGAPSCVLVALGDGRHELPVDAKIRRALGKEEGVAVTVRPLERVTD